MTTDSMESVRARFDRVAADWDANPGRVALARAVTDAIRNTIPLHAGMRVMDFGAGTGLLTLGLLPCVGHITAVDTSGEMLRVLRSKLDNLQITNVRTWLVDGLNGWPPETEFDLIVSSMVLHHVQDVRKAVGQLCARLRRGGWIALADLESEDGCFHNDPSGVFHHGFDHEEIRRWLEQAGVVETAAGCAHRMVRNGLEGIRREYPVFLVTGRAG